MDARIRDLERAYQAGDAGSGVLLIREYLRLGRNVGEFPAGDFESACYQYWKLPEDPKTLIQRGGWHNGNFGSDFSGGWIGQFPDGRWVIGSGWADYTGWG